MATRKVSREILVRQAPESLLPVANVGLGDARRAKLCLFCGNSAYVGALFVQRDGLVRSLVHLTYALRLHLRLTVQLLPLPCILTFWDNIAGFLMTRY